MDEELLSLRLKKREDSWILTLKTLQLDGFKVELNSPNV